MGEVTGISWCDATWNPWHGCAKVSAGCKNCYMFREKKQYGQDPTLVVRSKTKFNDPLKWVASGKAPQRCFTCSWSDFFIADADPWRAEAWEIIRRTPQITYQILTKRPELIAYHLPPNWGTGYPNVWLGVSCENQSAVDKRIPLLLRTPAALRFLSCEPLIGRIDLCEYLGMWWNQTMGCFEGTGAQINKKAFDGRSGIGWCIVGGESGSGARPMHPDWARSLRDQCEAAGVPFHFKQWGEWTPGENVDRDTGTVKTATSWSDGWLFGSENLANNEGHRDDEPDLYHIGTKAAGATLDGREWHEFPAEAARSDQAVVASSFSTSTRSMFARSPSRPPGARV